MREGLMMSRQAHASLAGGLLLLGAVPLLAPSDQRRQQLD
jgi:hypothetical protein